MAATPIDWHNKAAAARIGVTLDEYLSRIALGEKWCTRCKTWHSRQIFHIDRSRGDGLAASCNDYRIRRPKTPEQTQERKNRCYRKYYAGPAGAQIRACKMARKRNCDPISPRDRELVMESFLGLCAYCGETATTIDHAIPVKHGGHSRRGNLLACCVSCNSKKNTRDLEEFLLCAPNPSSRIMDELNMEDVL